MNLFFVVMGGFYMWIAREVLIEMLQAKAAHGSHLAAWLLRHWPFKEPVNTYTVPEQFVVK